MAGDAEGGAGDLLRRWDTAEIGPPVRTAYLVGGGRASDGRQALPTIDHIRENYRVMTGGEELSVRDLIMRDRSGGAVLSSLDFASSDGPASDLASDMALRTIWTRNHNYWVDKLRADTGGTWPEDRYFEAAYAINVAEHQQAAFAEIAKVLADGGSQAAAADLSSDDVAAGLWAGNAIVALFGESVSILDDTTGEPRHVKLADAFGAEAGDMDLAARSSRAAVGMDADVLEALPPSRTGLPAPPLDLASVYAARSRSGETPTFNGVRGQLFALTGLASLQPYENWADFQDRNGLSDDVIADLEFAYPEGFGAVDLWVGGLAEKPADGHLGATLGLLARSEPGLVEGQHPLLDFTGQGPLAQQIASQSFAGLAMRNLGMEEEDLAQMFAAPEVGVLRGTMSDDVIHGTDGDDIIYGGAGDDVLVGDGPGPIERERGEDAIEPTISELIDGGTSAEPQYGSLNTGNVLPHVGPAVFSQTVSEAAGSGAPTLPVEANAASIEPVILAKATGLAPAAFPIVGGDDTLDGGDGNDQIYGGTSDDTLSGDAGDDLIMGEQGDDTASGGTGDDLISGGCGSDALSGDEGADYVHGGSGDDAILGGAGADTLAGGSGNDARQRWQRGGRYFRRERQRCPRGRRRCRHDFRRRGRGRAVRRHGQRRAARRRRQRYSLAARDDEEAGRRRTMLAPRPTTDITGSSEADVSLVARVLTR